MKISEVSEKCGISTDTLRYYEKIGLLPSVNRSDSGIRNYSDLDVRRVEFIKCMRRAGLPIEVLIEYYGLVLQGDQSMDARKEILVQQRAQIREKMEELQKTLDLLDYKIHFYEDSLADKELKLVEMEV